MMPDGTVVPVPLGPWTWAAEGLSLADWRAEPGGLAGTIQKVLASPFGIRYDHVMTATQYIQQASAFGALGHTAHKAACLFLAGVLSRSAAEQVVTASGTFLDGPFDGFVNRVRAIAEFKAAQ